MLAQAVRSASARVQCQAEVRRRSWLHAALVANFKCLSVRVAGNQGSRSFRKIEFHPSVRKIDVQCSEIGFFHL